MDGKFFISGNFGVCYVYIKNVVYGYLQYLFVSDFGNGVYEDLDVEYLYFKLLLSFNLKMELDEGLLLCFVVLKVMVRLDFNLMGVNLMLSVLVKEFSQGKQEVGELLGLDDYDLMLSVDLNFYLDLMILIQFDLLLEWYYDDVNFMYVVLFIKDIKGYQVYLFSQVEYGGYIYNVIWLVSMGKVDIIGVELIINYFFNNLFVLFDGLGIQVNYIYIDFSIELGDDICFYDIDGFIYGIMFYQGLLKQVFNLVGMYEKDNWLICLVYNWCDEFLMFIWVNGFQVDDSLWVLLLFNVLIGYFDGLIVYKINDNYIVVLEVNNLVDMVIKNIMK